jgi:casein kinase II subunit beta
MASLVQDDLPEDRVPSPVNSSEGGRPHQYTSPSNNLNIMTTRISSPTGSIGSGSKDNREVPPGDMLARLSITENKDGQIRVSTSNEAFQHYQNSIDPPQDRRRGPAVAAGGGGSARSYTSSTNNINNKISKSSSGFNKNSHEEIVRNSDSMEVQLPPPREVEEHIVLDDAPGTASASAVSGRPLYASQLAVAGGATALGPSYSGGRKRSSAGSNSNSSGVPAGPGVAAAQDASKALNSLQASASNDRTGSRNKGPSLPSRSTDDATTPKHKSSPSNIDEEEYVEEDEEESSEASASDEDGSWITWFCSLRGNEFFCEVDEDYIQVGLVSGGIVPLQWSKVWVVYTSVLADCHLFLSFFLRDMAVFQDDFNLTGLNSLVPYYEYALDMVLDVEMPMEDSLTEEQQEIVESAAEMLYGLIHARYIVTNRGMHAMYEKYRMAAFGRCPRVFCQGQPVLPVGLSDLPRNYTVNVFCPRCHGLFFPKSTRQANIDGAYFGTTFPHLYLMTHPVRSWIVTFVLHDQGARRLQFVARDLSSCSFSDNVQLFFLFLNGMVARNFQDMIPAKPGQTYVPRVYGFRVHESSLFYQNHEDGSQDQTPAADTSSRQSRRSRDRSRRK